MVGHGNTDLKDVARVATRQQQFFLGARAKVHVFALAIPWHAHPLFSGLTP